MRELTVQARDESETITLGQRLGAASQGRGIVFLRGDLGAGKTTFTRGVLRSFGHRGAVKSPTYTLVEPYSPDGHQIYHFDLYRLGDPEELEYLGIRDYFDGQSLCLVEWPDRGVSMLVRPDLEIFIRAAGAGREFEFRAATELGQNILRDLEKDNNQTDQRELQ